MARIFVNDGTPDARDCAENYLFFNEKDPEAERLVMHLLATSDLTKPENRRRLQHICAISYLSARAEAPTLWQKLARYFNAPVPTARRGVTVLN